MSEVASPTGLSLLGDENFSPENLPLGFRKIFYRDILAAEQHGAGKFWIEKIGGVEISGTSYDLPISNWGGEI